MERRKGMYAVEVFHRIFNERCRRQNNFGRGEISIVLSLIIEHCHAEKYQQQPLIYS